ncbi:MAG: hypothetical protein WDN03_06540 [Rhizomicrobium sp.]
MRHSASKEGLFRAVLDRYDARRKDFMDGVLAATDPRSVAQAFLDGVADFAADTSGRNPPGCLLVQSGLSCSDQVIPDMLARASRRKGAGLARPFRARSRRRQASRRRRPRHPGELSRRDGERHAGAGRRRRQRGELRKIAAFALAAMPAGAMEPA